MTSQDPFRKMDQTDGVRALVVDDEVRLAHSIARGLRREGFDVDVVHDGLDALWRARELDYAAIVLDIMLPGRNGYEVCRDLRKEGIDTPILLLTAKDGEHDEAEGLDLGADDYLRKPFSFVVLVARLNAMTRRHMGLVGADNVLEVGDLTLHLGQLRADRNGVTVDLTAREFSVIEMLARHAPDVVPKGVLLDSVWGIDFEGDPNIVEVYVGYLRKKLGRDVVRTIRGAGYRLDTYR